MKLDLMSGKESIYPSDWISYDRDSEMGIRDEIKSFDKYFKKGTIKKVEVNNPRAYFLLEIYDKLSKGCEIVIRGNTSNSYFRKIWTVVDNSNKIGKYSVKFKSDTADKFALKHNFYWCNHVTSIPLISLKVIRLIK